MVAAALALLLASARPPPAPDDVRSSRSAAEAAEIQAAVLLARLADGEPPVEEVQRAAAAEARIDVEELEAWRRRARRAPWLPRLTAEVRHDERSYRVVGFTGSSETDTLRISPGTSVRLHASWDLDALVFNGNEIRAAEAASALGRRREERVERATRLWHERRRLRLSLLLSPPEGARERAEREMELDRVTAELDAVTGGLYRRGRAR